MNWFKHWWSDWHSVKDGVGKTLIEVPEANERKWMFKWNMRSRQFPRMPVGSEERSSEGLQGINFWDTFSVRKEQPHNFSYVGMLCKCVAAMRGGKEILSNRKERRDRVHWELVNLVLSISDDIKELYFKFWNKSERIVPSASPGSCNSRGIRSPS